MTEKGRNKWTKEETDALVNAWRDAFVELESHKDPVAWKCIQESVNAKGGGKTLDQIKKKLSNLKDRYKEAKEKNKRSGESQNTPKYYDVFGNVLGTRSTVKLGEVRESQETQRCDAEENPPDENDEAERDRSSDVASVKEISQPKRNKKKRASKTAAAGQLVDFLSEMQKQQQETMNNFMVGMQKIEESSRKHTANLLLGFAKIFAESNSSKGRKRNRQSDSEDSD